MEWSAVFLFMVFGTTGVQPRVVNILDDVYGVDVSKTFYKAVPKYIDVGKDYSVTLYTKSEGYKFTNLKDDKFNEFTIISGRAPNIKDKFVIKNVNVLDCSSNFPQFIRKSGKEITKYGVYTGIHHPFKILCLVDDASSNAFVISGETQGATKGILTAFNMLTKTVDNQEWILAPEIVELGDNITAIAFRKGKILLTQDMTTDKSAFNVITLTPIKIGDKFKYTLEHVLERIAELLKDNAQTRLEQTLNGNIKLRKFLDVELRRIEKHAIDLPLPGIILNGLYNEELQTALNETGDELLRLHQLNILGLDDKRYLVLRNQTKRDGILHVSDIERGADACEIWINTLGLSKLTDKKEIDFVCASTARFEDRRKVITASEKILVEISEWLHTQNDERWGLVGAVDILGEEYEINVPQAYNTDPPDFIQYDQIGNLIIFIKGKAYNIGSNFQYSWKPYPAPNVDPKIRLYFTDVFGNIVNCTGGRPTFKDKETGVTYPISIGDSTNALYCYGDIASKRSFLLGSRERYAKKGKLYAIDMTEIDIYQGQVVAEEIQEVGNNITAVTAHAHTGTIVLTEIVVISGRTSFNVLVLRKIPEEVLTFETFNPADGIVGQLSEGIPKIYVTYQLDDFSSTLNEALNTIIDIHIKNWDSRSVQLIVERKNLGGMAEILREYDQKINDSLSARNLSNLVSEINEVLKDSYNDPLKAEIKRTAEALVRLFNKEAELTDEILNVIPIKNICRKVQTPTKYLAQYLGNATMSCAAAEEWKKNERLHEIVNEFYLDIMHYNNYYVDFPFEYGF